MTTPNFHAKSTALEVVKGLNVKLDGKVVTHYWVLHQVNKSNKMKIIKQYF